MSIIPFKVTFKEPSTVKLSIATNAFFIERFKSKGSTNLLGHVVLLLSQDYDFYLSSSGPMLPTHMLDCHVCIYI